MAHLRAPTPVAGKACAAPLASPLCTHTGRSLGRTCTLCCLVASRLCTLQSHVSHAPPLLGDMPCYTLVLQAHSRPVSQRACSSLRRVRAKGWAARHLGHVRSALGFAVPKQLQANRCCLSAYGELKRSQDVSDRSKQEFYEELANVAQS